MQGPSMAWTKRRLDGTSCVGDCALAAHCVGGCGTVARAHGIEDAAPIGANSQVLAGFTCAQTLLLFFSVSPSLRGSICLLTSATYSSRIGNPLDRWPLVNGEWVELKGIGESYARRRAAGDRRGGLAW